MKEKTKKQNKASIGGQAVIEGVMMRGKRVMATAVRDPEGKIQIESERLDTEKQKKIAPALEYISKHYNEKITNEALASVSGLSVVYFRKLFAAGMGVSPIAYARKLRIEKAKEMLKSDYGSISDVAESLGYLTIYDFSRDFKKHTGVSPSKF